MTADPHHVVLDPVVRRFLQSHDGASKTEADIVHHAPAAFLAEEWVTVGAGEFGSVPVRIVRAGDGADRRPPVVYLPGGRPGGGPDRLVAELAVNTGVAVAVPQYDLGPAARHRVALEQAYATARWVSSDGHRHGLDPTHIGVAGDSFGGNLAIALCLLSPRRNEFRLAQLVAFTPVTDTAVDAGSCLQFADGYHLRLDDLQRFWDQYLPQHGRADDPTIAPLRADAAELKGFPPSLIITAEADVVRDQGEAFAARLRDVGVPTTAVRYEGTIHGFATLDALRRSSASRAATAQAASALRVALHGGTMG